MKDALKLLQLLTKSVPPPENMRHGLLLEHDRLTIALCRGEKDWQTFYLTDEDMDADPETLSKQLLEMVK